MDSAQVKPGSMYEVEDGNDMAVDPIVDEDLLKRQRRITCVILKPHVISADCYQS